MSIHVSTKDQNVMFGIVSDKRRQLIIEGDVGLWEETIIVQE